MKRILLVANVAKEHILKFHIPTIKAFRNHGWVVDVACSGNEDIPFCDHQYQMPWKRSPFSFHTLTGIKELKEIITQNHYDIVYCHTPVGGLVARLAARKARNHGTKVVYCAHGFHFFKGAPLKNWLIYYPIEKWLSGNTDVIFTVNREDYQLAKKKFNIRVQLVPEVGVDFSRLNVGDKAEKREEYRKDLGIESETTVLIYVAELIPNKNQKMLIDTLKILLDEGEKAVLILPGPEHDNGWTKEYVHSLNLDSDVRLLGWRSDVGALMNCADICVASSIREGFGINLVEAMYCGLPVVATNNRGHAMIIEDGKNGYLVPVNDCRLMAEKVKRLTRDKQLFKNIDVSRYDCSKISEELYERLNTISMEKQYDAT